MKAPSLPLPVGVQVSEEHWVEASVSGCRRSVGTSQETTRGEAHQTRVPATGVGGGVGPLRGGEEGIDETDRLEVSLPGIVRD